MASALSVRTARKNAHLGREKDLEIEEALAAILKEENPWNCMEQFAQIAENTPRCHLSRRETNQFIAGNALKTREK